ncbi:hypothetical protein [Pelagibacterium lacus]|nr:hypothetical protein [Pelagibacterium lacus]
MLLLVVAVPAFAQVDLSRPDPGIGEGFAQAMAKQFQEHFDIEQERADCLVYEVVELGRAHGYSGTLVEMAEEVRHFCNV